MSPHAFSLNFLIKNKNYFILLNWRNYCNCVMLNYSTWSCHSMEYMTRCCLLVGTGGITFIPSILVSHNSKTFDVKC